jgi:hypothetical protein
VLILSRGATLSGVSVQSDTSLRFTISAQSRKAWLARRDAARGANRASRAISSRFKGKQPTGS